MIDLINTFVWEIGNFQEYVKNVKNESYIPSQTFRMPQPDSLVKEQNEEDSQITLWRLILYPNGINTEYSNHISLYLEAIKTPYEIKKNIGMRYQKFNIGIGISNNNLNIRLSRSLICQHSGECDYDLNTRSSWGFNKFVLLDSIFPDGDRTKQAELFIQVTFSGVNKFTEAKNIENLEKWFEDENFTDVEFILDCGSRIKAHRIILVSNSEYFRNMLQGGWKEQHMDSIPIKGIKSETFRIILNYFYSGKLMDARFVVLCDVFRKADMMIIDDLKILIAKKLKMLINDNNWDEILLLAWKMNDPQLKIIGLEYAANNWERLKKRKVRGMKRLFATGYVEQLEELFLVANKRKDMAKIGELFKK